MAKVQKKKKNPQDFIFEILTIDLTLKISMPLL